MNEIPQRRTRVRGHWREGRPVRAHARNLTVRIAKLRDMRSFENPRGTRAFTIIDDPHTIYLAYPTDVNNIRDLSRVIEHESLHSALNQAGEWRASVMMDARRTSRGHAASEDIERGGLYRYEPRSPITWGDDSKRSERERSWQSRLRV